MHSVEELGANVPAFLAKLWKIVEDSETNDLICWSPSGSSFYIHDQARFARELLPLYYKHNNMASFVRQLNMYGFHKVVSIESGGLKVDRDEMEFAHQCFLMGHPYLLEHIKRKIPTNKSDDGRSGSKPEFVNKVLSEVKTMKGRQDSVDSQLGAMKRENEVLWREVAILRQKHLKQQQIVNKLIQFLVSMVQTSRGSGIGIKRHYPLMLNDTSHHSKASSKMNGNISEVNAVSSNSSPTGPVIHELDTTELLDDCAPAIEDETTSPEFLTTDLCGGVTTETASAASVNSPQADAAPPVNSTVSEVLLELAEECPISPEVMMSPTNIESLVETAKLSKGKQRAPYLKGSKRRKSRLPATTKPAKPVIRVKTKRNYPEEPVNVNNFLEIMLPNLVTDENTVSEAAVTVPLDTALQDDTVLKAFEDAVEIPDEQQSLKAATDAAISAISNVAAQKAAAAAASAPATTTTTTSAAYTKSNTEGSMQNPAVITIQYPSTEGSPTVISTPITVVGGFGTDCSNSNGVGGISTINNGSGVNFTTSSSSSNNSVGSVGESSKNNGENSNKDLALACTGPAEYKHLKDGLDVHVDNMQTELDSLKELLKGEVYNLDANMLLGVCAAGLGLDANTLKLFGDEALSYGIPLMQDGGDRDSKLNGGDVTGNELMTYSSNLLDLADMTELENWGSPTGSDLLQDSTVPEVNTPVVMLDSPGFSGPAAKKRKISNKTSLS